MNRQVPETIAIIGDGRVARHMMRYFQLVNQPFLQWCRGHSNQQAQRPSKLARFKQRLKNSLRSKQQQLEAVIEKSDVVLILISDDQIVPFIQAQPALKHKTCVHFSGSLQTDLAYGCHPLMTFGTEGYDLETYQQIPFVVDEGIQLKQLMPKLDNPEHSINAEHKAMYHACCVMAGNFSQILWQAVVKELQNMSLPADVMSQYLQQNTHNFITLPDTALTGPLVRGDHATVAKHLQVMQGHPLGDVYQAFIDLYQQQTTISHRKSS